MSTLKLIQPQAEDDAVIRGIPEAKRMGTMRPNSAALMFRCHCEPSIRWRGNLNILKYLCACFGRYTPSLIIIKFKKLMLHSSVIFISYKDIPIAPRQTG